MANFDGLDRMKALLSALGNPEADFRAIHIAGTNGKGSTAVMTASILEEAGYTVGLYTSPHLEDECERVQIWDGNHHMIEQTRFDELKERVRAVEEKATVFEVYTAAAYHDTGLSVDRKTHHLESGKIIRADKRLGEWFTPDQIEVIAQAAEDHRASSDHEPRTIYGKIIAEADRQIIPESIILRTVQYGFKNYPELDKEGHWRRTCEHMAEKYDVGGYLKLWIPESRNADGLARLREIIHDKNRLRILFEAAYNTEKA
jgi:uncharacterized protein